MAKKQKFEYVATVTVSSTAELKLKNIKSAIENELTYAGESLSGDEGTNGVKFKVSVAARG